MHRGPATCAKPHAQPCQGVATLRILVGADCSTRLIDRMFVCVVGGGHKAMVLVWLPLAAPIGLSPFAHSDPLWARMCFGCVNGGGGGRPVDRGVWTAKTVKRPRQQPAHPQYANYSALLTRKRHTMPHSAQPQHTNDWAPRTRKRHQQEHRPQRPTERSNPTQHAKGRPGDCPGPREETTTGRNVTQRGGGATGSVDIHPLGALSPAVGRGGGCCSDSLYVNALMDRQIRSLLPGGDRQRAAASPPLPPRSPPPPPPHPSALKSVLESANPHVDSEGASGCPWSPARATAPSPGRPTPGVVKQDKSSEAPLTQPKHVQSHRGSE